MIPISRVGVIGLGVMGLPIACRLNTAAKVTAFDVSAKQRASAERAGIVTAESPAGAARDAAVLVVVVRTLEQVEECLFGPDGAAGALPPEGIVLLMSTVGATGARVLAERLAADDLNLLDAPMSGSPARAAEGDLLVVAGGAESTVARARPLLELLAGTLVVVGPNAGDGQSLKTVNQLLCGVHIVAAAEALLLAQSLGLELRLALQALGAGAATSSMLGNRGPRIIQALEEDASEFKSRLDIFAKDMGIVADAARGGSG